MKKKYFRKLALWMAVLMILLSVPTNAVAFPSTGATATEHMTATEGITETTLTDPDEEIVESFEWIIGDTASTETGLRSPSDFDSTTSTTSDSQFLTTPIVPEGVYALQSVAYEEMWMSVPFEQYWSNPSLQLETYGDSPVSSFSRGGLFKISQYQDTNVYVIRLMTNNMLGITYNSSSVYAGDIDPCDDNADAYFLFSIIPTGEDEYIIQSVMDDTCLAAPSSTELFTSLVSQTLDEAGDCAKWRLQPYTDIDRCGVTVVRGGALVAGVQTTVQLAAGWSTMIDVTCTGLSLGSQYSSIVTGTWNSSTSVLSIHMHDEGSFQIIAQFEDEEEDVVQNYNITYTVTLPFAEGVYYIKNKALDLYVQIDNDTAPDYSANGAALELFAFDGGEYQRWTVEHVVDGYYKILSLCDKAASIDASYVNAERHIWQAFYLGDTYYNQQWTFTQTGRGSYVIRPRSGESYSTDWCWAAQDDEAVNNGPNVEHKAYTNDSNYMDEWVLFHITGTEAFLLGITDTGHDHATALGAIMPDILDLGYQDFNFIITDHITKTSVRNSMSDAKIYVSRSHGNTSSDGTYILLSNSGTQYIHSLDLYNFETGTPVIDLSDCDLMLFVACYTGALDYISLPHAAVCAGAEAAVGFETSIGCTTANNWTKYFFEYYLQGYSVSLSSYYASMDCENKNGINTYRVVAQSANY